MRPPRRPGAEFPICPQVCRYNICGSPEMVDTFAKLQVEQEGATISGSLRRVSSISSDVRLRLTILGVLVGFERFRSPGCAPQSIMSQVGGAARAQARGWRKRLAVGGLSSSRPVIVQGPQSTLPPGTPLPGSSAPRPMTETQPSIPIQTVSHQGGPQPINDPPPLKR